MEQQLSGLGLGLELDCSIRSSYFYEVMLFFSRPSKKKKKKLEVHPFLYPSFVKKKKR